MRHRKFNSFFFTSLSIFIIVNLLLLKCSSENIDKRVKKERIYKIGYLPIAASLPLFVAIEENYFEKQNIKIQLYEFKSSNDLAVAAVSNKIDLMVTCATNAVIDLMITTNKTMTAFMTNCYLKKNTNTKSTDYLIARKGFSITGLKNKTIGFFPGSVCRVFARKVLPKYGLNINDFTYIELAPKDWLPALKAGRIDAVNAVEPIASLILSDKKSYDILIDGFYAELMPNVPLSCSWFVDERLTQSEQETFRDIFKTAVKRINTSKDTCVKHYIKYTKIPVHILPDIGLNKWQITFYESSAHRNLKNLCEILYKNHSIKAIPKFKWID